MYHNPVKVQKRNEAKARQEAHDNLTNLQKIQKLDRRLGIDVGASKERAEIKTRMTSEELKQYERWQEVLLWEELS